MVNRKNIGLVSIGMAVLLALTNPSKEDYASWATQRIKEANGDSILSNLFFAATGNMLLSNTTTRKSFVLFSIFETNAFNKKISSIGILSSFIPLADSRLAESARAPEHQTPTASSTQIVAKMPTGNTNSPIPSFSLKYSTEGVPKPIGINGVADLMSAPTDPTSLCFPSFETGVIEQVEYIRGSMIPGSFKVRRPDGFLDQAEIDSNSIKRISEANLPWLNSLVTPKRSVFIISYRCGVSGRIVNVRDIYDLEYIRSVVAK